MGLLPRKLSEVLLIAFLFNSLQKNHHINYPGTLVELIGDHLFFWLTIITDENTLTLMNEQLVNGLALLTPFNLDHFHAGFRTEGEIPAMQIEEIYKVINDMTPTNV